MKHWYVSCNEVHRVTYSADANTKAQAIAIAKREGGDEVRAEFLRDFKPSKYEAWEVDGYGREVD